MPKYSNGIKSEGKKKMTVVVTILSGNFNGRKDLIGI